ncbi:MAG: hypothetical protein U9Q30_02245, partial [Campylobacterota bacterium]|nr:hypothetical protein [Campylobacterota bacterium]
MKDYSDINPNDFTQKDLMLHLLQVSQHTVTREEVKEDILDIKSDIKKLDARFDKVDTTIKEEVSKIDDKFEKVDARFD